MQWSSVATKQSLRVVVVVVGVVDAGEVGESTAMWPLLLSVRKGEGGE